MSGLTVRSFERREIDLPVQFVVAEEHREQVRFGLSSGAEHMFTVPGRAIDVSRGGMGMTARHFLPRMCEGTLRVFAARADAANGWSDDRAPQDPVFEHLVKVRRVTMTGHEPQYFIGLAFVDPDPGLEERVLHLLGPQKPRLTGAPAGAGGPGAPGPGGSHA